MITDFSEDCFVFISSVMHSETSLIIYQSIRREISEDLRDRLRLWDSLKYSKFIENTSNALTSNVCIF